MVKKRKAAVKKTTPKKGKCQCSVCHWVLPLLVLVLIWWKPAELWSKIVVTLAILLMLLKMHMFHSTCKI